MIDTMLHGHESVPGCLPPASLPRAWKTWAISCRTCGAWERGVCHVLGEGSGWGTGPGPGFGIGHVLYVGQAHRMPLAHKAKPRKPLKSFKPRRPLGDLLGDLHEKTKLPFMDTLGYICIWAYLDWEWESAPPHTRVIVLYKPMARPPRPRSSLPLSYKNNVFSLIYFHTQMWEFSCNCPCVWTRANLYKIARITSGCVQSAADFVACFLGHLVNAISFGHTHRAHRRCSFVCMCEYVVYVCIFVL